MTKFYEIQSWVQMDLARWTLSPNLVRANRLQVMGDHLAGKTALDRVNGCVVR